MTWSYFYLYVILDIYSRYVVGWMIADTLNLAFKLHPNRFKGKQPRPQSLPEAAWINKPNSPSEVITHPDH